AENPPRAASGGPAMPGSDRRLGPSGRSHRNGPQSLNTTAETVDRGLVGGAAPGRGDIYGTLAQAKGLATGGPRGATSTERRRGRLRQSPARRATHEEPPTT